MRRDGEKYAGVYEVLKWKIIFLTHTHIHIFTNSISLICLLFRFGIKLAHPNANQLTKKNIQKHSKHVAQGMGI